MFDKITIDPEIMGGKPCIRDTRIPVTIILKLLSKKVSYKTILETYPELAEDDIQAALEFAAWSVSESSIPVMG